MRQSRPSRCCSISQSEWKNVNSVTVRSILKYYTYTYILFYNYVIITVCQMFLLQQQLPLINANHWNCNHIPEHPYLPLHETLVNVLAPPRETCGYLSLLWCVDLRVKFICLQTADLCPHRSEYKRPAATVSVSFFFPEFEQFSLVCLYWS